METDELGRVDDVPRAPLMWSLMQASKFLGVSERTLKRWVEFGMPVHRDDPFPKPPPFFRVGGRLKFRPSELKDWLEQRRGAA